MAIPKAEFTTIQPASGGRVHAISLRSARTACGRKFDGWKIADRGVAVAPGERWVVVRTLVSCQRCKAKMFLQVRP